MSNKILSGVLALNLLATAALTYTICQGHNVKSYIEKNPQTIIDAVNKHMQTQQNQSDDQAMEKVKANKAFLYDDARHPFLGSKDATFTIIEFLDYNCGYCKKAYEAVVKVLETDKNVRVVLIEIPILHESSALAAKWALAAHDANGYAAFHKSLMEHKGPITEDILSGFAQKAGLDVAAVKAKAESQEIGELVAENLTKANEIGIQGTPGFIIGDQIIRGYLPFEELKAAIETARSPKN